MDHDLVRWSHNFENIRDDRGVVAAMVAVIVFTALILAVVISWQESSDSAPTRAISKQALGFSLDPSEVSVTTATTHSKSSVGSFVTTTTVVVIDEGPTTTPPAVITTAPVATATSEPQSTTTTVTPATTTTTVATTTTTTTLGTSTTLGDYFCLGQADGTCTDPTGMVLCTLLVGDGHCRDETGQILCGISPQSAPECIPGLDPRA